jgi:hypothetical protein
MLAASYSARATSWSMVLSWARPIGASAGLAPSAETKAAAEVEVSGGFRAVAQSDPRKVRTTVPSKGLTAGYRKGAGLGPHPLNLTDSAALRERTAAAGSAFWPFGAGAQARQRRGRQGGCMTSGRQDCGKQNRPRVIRSISTV